MKRRIGILWLVLVLSLGLCTPTLAAGQAFSDVPVSHWSYVYVQRAYEDGVVNGVGGGRFAPEDTLTIAQFMTMMTRAFYAEDVAEVEDAIEDPGDWYLPGLAVALEYGLLTNTYVDPETWYGYLSPCWRYEMAAIMYNIILSYGLDDFILDGRTAAAIGANIPDFPEIPSEYRVPVAALVKAGVITGIDNAGTFAGESTVTRAQAATIYCRFAQLMEDAWGQPEQPDDSTQPDDSIQPDDVPQPEEPSQPTEPTQPEEPSQPTEPVQPSEPVQPEQPTQPVDDLQAMREEMLAEINAQRAQAGLSPLTLNDTAGDAAQVRAEELVTLFSHTRPNGESCFTALKEAGVSYRAAGENIAFGYPTVASVMEGWMNSEGHRANILNANFTQVGIGFVKSESGYGSHWVQLFIG